MFEFVTKYVTIEYSEKQKHALYKSVNISIKSIYKLRSVYILENRKYSLHILEIDVYYKCNHKYIFVTFLVNAYVK